MQESPPIFFRHLPQMFVMMKKYRLWKGAIRMNKHMAAQVLGIVNGVLLITTGAIAIIAAGLNLAAPVEKHERRR